MNAATSREIEHVRDVVGRPFRPSQHAVSTTTPSVESPRSEQGRDEWSWFQCSTWSVPASSSARRSSPCGCDIEMNLRASDETLEIKPTPQLQERPPQDTRAPGASNWLLRELKCLVTGS